MRIVNRTIIADAVRDYGPLSRAELRRRTSISAATVSSIVEELIRNGVLRELGDDAAAGVGRPARLLGFNEATYHLGCELTPAGGIRVALMSLSDRIEELGAIEAASSDPIDVAEAIGRCVEDAVAGRDGAAIRGVGVGVPGVTSVESGIVHWAPSLGWREVPLAELVSVRLGLSTIVDNDVNLALIGEVSAGAATRARHAVLVSFRDGIGGAVLIDGRLHRGRGGAGEIGYLTGDAPPTGGDLRAFGAFERRVFELIEREAAAAGIEPLPYAFPTAALAERLIAAGALRAGPARAELVETVASGLASIAALLDPDVIVLSGWIERLGGELGAELEERLAERVPSPPPLRLSVMGENAALAGAALSVRRTSLEAIQVVRAH